MSNVIIITKSLPKGIEIISGPSICYDEDLEMYYQSVILRLPNGKIAKINQHKDDFVRGFCDNIPTGEMDKGQFYSWLKSLLQE